MSTRYDATLVEWATAKLNVSKAALVKLAMDRFLAELMKEAA